MTRVIKNVSRKILRPLAVPVIAAALFLLFPQIAGADGVSPPLVFTRGSFVYVVEPERVVFLSMDTRGSHTVYAAPNTMFGIVSAVRSGDMIWMSNRMGAVVAVNMQTGTVEEFGRGLAGGGGQIDVDRRFVWVSRADTLYRMDLTTREWAPFSLPGGANADVRGLVSFNDQIHLIADNAVYILATLTGDWVVVPHRGFTLGVGDFRRLDGAAYFTRGRRIYRYDPSKRLWHTIAVGGRIGAVNLTQGRLMASTENRVYDISTRDFTPSAQPSLPMLRGIRALLTHNDQIVCVTDRGLAIYTTPFNFNLVPYPEGARVGGDVFAFSYYGHVTLYTGGDFIVYNHDRRLWSGVRVVNRAREERRETHGWSEDGTRIDITEEVRSTLTGTATVRQLPSAAHEDGDFVVDMGETLANATINVRTEDGSGRVLDLTLDNAVTTLPPQKGFYYKGIDGDVLDRASFGLQGTGLAASRTTPGVLVEGGSAVFSGNAKADNRDRSVLSATAGGGHILSRTEWRTFGFNPSGIYEIYPDGVDPSSVRMYVDGIPLPGTDFVYEPNGSFLRLLRRDKVDPLSIVQISYSIRAFPADREEFELFPENNLGRYGFVEGAVSPRSWMSARAGLLALDKGGENVTPIVTAGLPVEWRGGASRSLLVHPEVAYDNLTGAHTAAFTMGVRENRAFGSYSGHWVGNDFSGVDRHMFGGSDLRGEHEINVGYDLRDDLRASWYQLHRRVDGSDLSHFELRSSYTGRDLMPDIELSASSRVLETGSNRNRKETLSLRVSDLSSRLLSEWNSLHNVGYDLAWTEYQNGAGRSGRTLYSALNVSPVSSLTLAGMMMYRLNPIDYHVRTEFNPSVAVYARDLPRGFDVSAAYSVFTGSFRNGESNVGMGRNIAAYFYPGEYVGALDKIILYARIANETESRLPPTVSPVKYAFESGDFTYYSVAAEEFGLIFFPKENLLLSSFNSRFRDFVSPDVYHTNERIKWWFENGSSLEGNIRFTEAELWRNLNGDAMYEHKWSVGFLTGAGAFGARHVDQNAVNHSGGPQFMVSVTKGLSGFIRSVENGHRLRITMLEADPQNPDVGYALYLRLMMPPNMSLVGEMNMTMTGEGGTRVAAGLYLHAGF